MLRFFRSARAEVPDLLDRPPPSVGEDRRIYAVGDVHGRLDLLRELIDKIAADDWARGPVSSTELVLLGDYVDRGPQSAQVIDFIVRLARWWPNLHCLMGNHEEVFLLALRGDESALRFMTRIGGRETILSYGIEAEALDAMTLGQLRDALSEIVPEDHVAFLAGLDEQIAFGDYAFVHAGIRPGVPLDSQEPKDLRWIRDEFLESDVPHERFIVHGHSITEEVEVLSNRIGIDTGAYATGRLTAIGLEGTEQWFLTTGGDNAYPRS